MLLRSRCCTLMRLLPAVPRAPRQALWAMRRGCALLGHMEPGMGTHVIPSSRRPDFAPLFWQGHSEPNQSWTRWSAFGPFRYSKGSGARAP